jgi:regulator of sigma E protease
MLMTVLAAIFVFGLLIFAHELGHFICAKLSDMRVDEFAVGFGPKLVGFRYGETNYSLRIIPLGGYNKIAGMDPEEEEDERSFGRKPLWARGLTIFGGSFMNFLLPIILFTIIFSFSGINQPSTESLLGQVFAGRPADQAGLQTGDRIVAIDGMAIQTWQDFVSKINSNPGNKLVLTVQRKGQELLIAVTPELDPNLQRGLIGVAPHMIQLKPTILQSAGYAISQTVFIIKEMLRGLLNMFSGLAPADVAGPIGVAQMAGQFAQLGIIPLLQFAAFVSLNLGLINLLPLPALDGGHIVLLFLEGIRRRPISKGTLYKIQMVGFALILALVVMSTYKDLIRLKIF